MNKLFLSFSKELAGLAEAEYGIESNAMFNDLHAPSVPVQPIDAGSTTASTTTKVCLHLLFITLISIGRFQLGWCRRR